MKLNEFIEKLNLKILTEPDCDKDVTGCYSGDLLSWVMSTQLLWLYSQIAHVSF